MEVPNSSISNFKRFARRILLPWLGIVLLVGVVTASLFERYIVLGSKISGAYKVNRIIQGNPPGEIPIFGSSRAEGGYIPDSIGSNYFNYGMSGVRDNVSLFLLEKACARPGNTPILLNFDLDGLQYGVGDVRNYIVNATDPGVKKLLGKEYKPHYAIPVVKYYGAFVLYIKYYLNTKLNLTKYTNKSARIEKNVLTGENFERLVAQMKNISLTFKNEPVLERELFQIIRKYRQRPIVIISAPHHPAAFQAITNFSTAQAFLAQLAEEPNVRVIDCSLMDLPDDHFFDMTHLNYTGAKVFSRALRDSLQRR